MSGRKAIIPEQSVLAKHNCTHLIEPSTITNESTEILLLGNEWKVSSTHSTIFNDNEFHQIISIIYQYLSTTYPSIIIDSLSQISLIINDYCLRIPPMLFTKDNISLSFNYFSIQINPIDSMIAYAAQYVLENEQRYPVKVIKVAQASKWNQKIVDDGFVVSTNDSSNDTSKSLFQRKDVDWTYSSDYCFTILNASNSKYIISARTLLDLVSVGQVQSGGAKNKLPHNMQINVTEGSGIEYEMLKQTNKPILFYDELLLYQDDLEDCGEIIFDAKVRVMDDCWFILIKQYLRVDGVLARSRETRLFHKFLNGMKDGGESGRDAVIIQGEIAWRELNGYTVGNGGIHANEYPFSERSDHPLLKSKESLTNSNALPLVNEYEGIPLFFSLIITK